ncbi:adrenocorticotropic hormone receptor-like [Anneissia japonica]|uniref:adrenocorticotropic hormone receptor-like n=1 Tax=Anneissia japonica TaxID=1529436 RepID=UPI001425ACE4|nr:adrenocorticotropic hormone receptor-like [Anneissia japonica]
MARNNSDVVLNASIYALDTLCALTFLTNLLVFIVLITDTKLHKKQNAFIGLLSLADMSYSISTFLAIHKNPVGSGYRGVLWSIADGALLTSVLALAAIAIDRYIALIWAPFRYNIIVTPKRCVTVCLLLVFGPFVLFSIIYAFFDNTTANVTITCVTAAIIIMNTCIYRNIYKQLQRKQVGIPVMQQDLEESKKLLMTFTIIVGIFIITWTPLIILTLTTGVLGLFGNGRSYFLMMIIGYEIGMVNSLANPIIYWFRMPTFRRAALKLVCS